MTSVEIRNPEVRLSAALDSARLAIAGDDVQLRALLDCVGAQGLLLFCAILAMPFLLPLTLPLSSTALGVPMLLVGWAVMMNRLAWIPDSILDRTLPGQAVRQVLERAARIAARFEHLVKPRLLRLSASPAANSFNGSVLIIGALTLMVPLPLIPFANSLPAAGIILLCLGLTERDGILIVLGHVLTLL